MLLCVDDPVTIRLLETASSLPKAHAHYQLLLPAPKTATASGLCAADLSSLAGAHSSSSPSADPGANATAVAGVDVEWELELDAVGPYSSTAAAGAATHKANTGNVTSSSSTAAGDVGIEVIDFTNGQEGRSVSSGAHGKGEGKQARVSLSCLSLF